MKTEESRSKREGTEGTAVRKPLSIGPLGGFGAGVWGLALKILRGTRTSGLTLTNKSTLSPGGHGW